GGVVGGGGGGGGEGGGRGGGGRGGWGGRGGAGGARAAWRLPRCARRPTGSSAPGGSGTRPSPASMPTSPRCRPPDRQRTGWPTTPGSSNENGNSAAGHLACVRRAAGACLPSLHRSRPLGGVVGPDRQLTAAR